ncbi:MAG: ABC transporter permease, partial [Candidatus Bathyarchaeota archaeon]|nr:ABC transporter permease [Candidatus Bathyarchaeota archaeon]
MRFRTDMIRIKMIFEKYGIYVFLLLIVFFSSLVSPAFLKPQNIVNILNPAAALGMVAIGQTFVILTGGGGLDLSVASVMATVAVIAAAYTGGQDSQLLPAVAICLFFGILIGLINGLLITKLRVPPIMATLGMMIILLGGRFLYTKGIAKGSYPPILRFFGTGFVGPIPASVLSLAIMVVMATIVLKKTVFGRQVYATGANINTAILSGYNTDLILVMIYMISGLMASIAGLYIAGWVGVADNWVGQGYEVDSIAAVVMGGTSFEGGRGGVLGTMAGVLILVTIYNLVLLLHLPVQTQYMVKGAVIIIAASFYVRRGI